MNRRDALKRVAILMGGTLSPSVVSAILSGCRISGDKWRPKIVTLEQDELITTIVELIIPETDTPGAKAARVNEFVDLMLADWFTPTESEHFMKGLAELASRAQETYSSAFIKCTIEEQTSILEELENESLSHRENSSSESETDVLKPFFSQMKELTLIGYYTSEIGATQELKYLGAAINYAGCVPFSDIGRAWSD